MPPRVLVAVALALLAAPVLAAGESETATQIDKRVQRLIAIPTPMQGFFLLGDAVVWRVDVSPSTIVTVEAEGTKTGPFYLRAERLDAAPSTFLLPSTHAGVHLETPGAWRVTVDPAAGAPIDITVRFRGHVGGAGGAPATFTLTPLESQRACLLPSVCLP